MIDKLQNPLSLGGRLLLAALFLPAGLTKLTGVAGIALVVGYRTRAAALVLAAFTIVASVFFHNYWAAPADAQMVQQLLFFKNVAVVGGLLTLAAWGAGAWSVDARRAPAIGYRQQVA
jgi:putative oxidoreductase